MPQQSRKQRRRGPSTDKIARDFFKDHPVIEDGSYPEIGRRNVPFLSSVNVASRAIETLNAKNKLEKAASKIIQLWGKPVAARNAITFWNDPDHSLATFMRDAYANGLSTLGYANAAAIYNDSHNHGQNVAERLFHPDTRQVAELTLQALTDVAGNLDTLRLLDAPQPDGIVLHTYTDSWRDETTTADLPARLASYEPTALGIYLRTERKYSSFIETPNGTVNFPR